MSALWRWLKRRVKSSTTPDDTEAMYRILRNIIEELNLRQRQRGTSSFSGTGGGPPDDNLWVQDPVTGLWGPVGDGRHEEEE